MDATSCDHGRARMARDRIRRSFLTAAAAATGALAAQALARPLAAAATSVVLGGVNDATSPTIIRNTKAAIDAVAIKGIVTTAGPGGATAGVWGQSNANNGYNVATYTSGIAPASQASALLCPLLILEPLTERTSDEAVPCRLPRRSERFTDLRPGAPLLASH